MSAQTKPIIELFCSNLLRLTSRNRNWTINNCQLRFRNYKLFTQQFKMKKKLDLNGLLAKYEGISNSHNVPFYSPAKNYQYGKENTVEQEFYQSRHQQPNWVNMPSEEVTYTQALGCNFQMSKSECESFLLRIKDELRNQERQMQGFVENAQKHIH